MTPTETEGVYAGNDGREYCLPSTLGGFDLSPLAQARDAFNIRMASVERNVERMAAERHAAPLEAIRETLERVEPDDNPGNAV